MTVRGLVLAGLQVLSALLMLASTALGYGASFGVVALHRHIPWGFLSAVAVAFTHAMTLFYFVGLGVGMREAAGSRRGAAPLLEEAARLRRRIAWPLGLAIVSLMAAVILGGGSHTRRLPGWPHHLAGLMALALNLRACLLGASLIAAQERTARRLEESLEGAGSGGSAEL